MRGGDFHGSHPIPPTNEIFVVAAMKYMLDSIGRSEKISRSKLSVVLFGDDEFFADDIRIKVLVSRRGLQHEIAVAVVSQPKFAGSQSYKPRFRLEAD